MTWLLGPHSVDVLLLLMMTTETTTAFIVLFYMESSTQTQVWHKQKFVLSLDCKHVISQDGQQTWTSLLTSGFFAICDVHTNYDLK